MLKELRLVGCEHREPVHLGHQAHEAVALHPTGDVTRGYHVVQKISRLVAGDRPPHVGDHRAPILVQVALGVANLPGPILAGNQDRLLADSHVLGHGERLRVLSDQLILRAPEQLAEGVIGLDHSVIGIGEDDRGHVVLERTSKAPVADREQFRARQHGGSGELLGPDSREVRFAARAVVTNRRDHPRLAVDLEGGEGDVDRQLASVSAHEREF